MHQHFSLQYGERYKFSILLNCINPGSVHWVDNLLPVMERHASLNTGLTLCVCSDISDTVHACRIALLFLCRLRIDLCHGSVVAKSQE